MIGKNEAQVRGTGFENRRVECTEHGVQPASFVCRHIVEGLGNNETLGFWRAHDPDNPRPDAWCTACNELLERHHGEWNDVTEGAAGVTLLCGACYDRAREMNAGVARDSGESGG